MSEAIWAQKLEELGVPGKWFVALVQGGRELQRIGPFDDEAEADSVIETLLQEIAKLHEGKTDG